MSSQSGFLSVEKYVSPSTLDTYWKEGNWKECPHAKQYVYWHRYTGESGYILLEKMGVINSSEQAPKSFFDIGCGAGLLTSYVYDHSKNQSVTSLDVDQGMVDEVERKSSVGRWPKWTGIKANFYDNKLADDSFDFVAAHFFLFYLAKDYPRALKECHRLLKSGGIIGWTAPSVAYPLEDIVKVIKTLPSPPPGAENFPPAMPDLGCNTVEGSRKLLESNGFKPVFIQEFELQSPFTSARQAAESCASVLLNWVENWPEPSVHEVMLGLKKMYEAQFVGGKGTRTNKIVVAVGQKV